MIGRAGMATIDTSDRVGKMAYWLIGIQGSYYNTHGLWPIVDIRSFMAITGPK